MEHPFHSLFERRQKARQFYKQIGFVYCPYLTERIYFNSEGFNHLRYRGPRKERDFKVQELRYRLLYLAPRLLELTHTLQEYEERSFEYSKITSFFGFIAILDRWKVKVIVKKTGEGRYTFWSVIPNWRTRKSDSVQKIHTHVGDLLED